MWGYAFGIFLGNDIYVVPKKMRWNSVRNLMCVGRYAEKMQWSEAKWNLFEMPAIDMSVLCIPAECDNIKLPIEYEIASRWDANLLYDICRHFASVMLHFASLISHNLRCIPAYAHLIPTGFFLLNYHRGNLYIISYFQFGDTLLVCIETCQRHVATLWCNVAPIFFWIKKLLRCVWEAVWSLTSRSSLCGCIVVWVGYFL